MEASPQTISIEPNWEGMREWVKNVARTDLAQAVRINDSMESEGVSFTELADLADPERAQ